MRSSVGPPDAAHAVFGCDPYPSCSTVLEDVGSTSPAGDGAFGQADLSGNLGEWTLDEFVPDLAIDCVNCVDTTYPDTPPPDDGPRVRMGGSFRSSDAD